MLDPLPRGIKENWKQAVVDSQIQNTTVLTSGPIYPG